MRYLVDEALCSGRGQCVVAAPDVFALDDDGFNRDTGVSVSVSVEPGHERAAENGAGVCPEQAIRVLTGP